MIINNIQQVYDIVGNEIMLSGLSNSQIATKAGVTESMVSSVRGGRYIQVSFEKFIVICKALEIELQINIKK
jgi:DNA-binding Xre family transcriptional regulator